MKKIFLLILFVMFSVIFLTVVHAEVQYPVAELGNCATEQACEVYCDNVDNMEACLNYAEKNNLMTRAEIEEARKFMPLMKSGQTPGGCKNQKECDEFCNKEENLNACIDFAVKAGVIDAKEAEMAKKTGGKGPGGCKREECKTYCDDESHINECVDFAVKYGMMDASEAEMVKKTGGKGPGNCKGKEECDAYCEKKENLQVCIDFSVQYGFMTAEEAERVKKSGGESPGNCKGKEECDKFCESEEGWLVCVKFSYEHGMMSEEEYQKVMKSGRKGGGWSGPGGCKSEQECRDYCESGEHTQECMDDALKNGYVTQEEYDKQMEGFRGPRIPEGENESGEKGCEDCVSKCEASEGQMLDRTDCVDNQCRCYYKDVEVPREEPIDQGEQIPQTEMTPGGGSGGSSPGDEGITSPGDAPSGDGGDSGSSSGESSGSSSGDSGGGGESSDSGAGVTGAVIKENSGNNFIQNIIEFLKNLIS